VKRTPSRWFGVLLVVIVSACIEPYQPPVSDKDLDIMVIDGFLDMTAQSAGVELALASPLASRAATVKIDDALVEVLDDKGQRYRLKSAAGGKYFSDMPLNTDTHYSLFIRRADGREYASDQITLRKTPQIDSITWKFDGHNILFYVYCHDESNAAKYFRWDFNETYEFSASFESRWKMVSGQPVIRDRSEYVDICYRTDTATVINIGTTKQLSGSVVFGLDLYTLPGESVKVSRRYSMDLRQSVISPAEYSYWKEVKKQNEIVGGLFDPQPSQIFGNVRRVDARETVIGYFSGGEVARKRVLFDFYSLSSEILDIRRSHPCNEANVVDFTLAELRFMPPNYLLIDAIRHPITNAVEGYATAPDSCVDCRTRKGTTTPPDYWPKDRL
jgi:hypothetical protein